MPRSRTQVSFFRRKLFPFVFHLFSDFFFFFRFLFYLSSLVFLHLFAFRPSVSPIDLLFCCHSIDPLRPFQGRPDTPDTDDLESASAETPPPSATPEPPSAVPPPPPTPSEEDFEHIKLISNGAYGAVYLVRHKGANF